MTRLPPACAIDLQIAAPTPWVPPVTKIVRPERLNGFINALTQKHVGERRRGVHTRRGLTQRLLPTESPSHVYAQVRGCSPIRNALHIATRVAYRKRQPFAAIGRGRNS